MIPSPPVSHGDQGNSLEPSAATKGIRAAATISTVFTRLKIRWQLMLLRSYHAIWSSRRPMMGSELGIRAPLFLQDRDSDGMKSQSHHIRIRQGVPELVAG